MRKWGALVIAALVLSSMATPTQAAGDSIEQCRISASEWQTVSLGFPVRQERLKYLERPRILVIPIRLSDNPEFVFTDEMKEEYLQAGRAISKFSKEKTKIEFIFNKTIKSPHDTPYFVDLRDKQKTTFNSKEGPATWNFVSEFLSENDPVIDFTGINAVILQASSKDLNSEIAEAMMYYKAPEKPFSNPNKTAEGEIMNAVLLDKQKGVNTIAHEIMHLYGLTDLYGSSTGPGRLSLMANNEMTLLTYEKWVLGWHPDSFVQCLAKVSNSAIETIEFDYTKDDNLLVMKTSLGTVYIAETQKDEYDRRFISFYTLNQEGRPPITLYQNPENKRFDGINIGTRTAIGAHFVGPEVSMIISDISSTTLSLSIYSTSWAGSAEVIAAIQKAAEAKIRNASPNASPTPSPTQTQTMNPVVETSKTPTPKKITITCLKGKTIKKVTAVNPKCPAGYKKK